MASNGVEKCPKDFLGVTPYLNIKDAAKALDFYKEAFGATEAVRMNGPDGKITHAEMRIGGSPFMFADECTERGNQSPSSLGGTSVGLMIYVENSDEAFEQAIKAGAKAEMPVQTHFYGDRSGTLVDPFGHKWTIATHVEDVPSEEMKKRMAAMFPPEQK